MYEGSYNNEATVQKLNGCGDNDITFSSEIVKTPTHDLLNISVSKDINHRILKALLRVIVVLKTTVF